MPVYVQKNNDGEYINVNAFTAFEGFLHLGYEVRPFVNVGTLDLEPDDIVVGYISTVHQALRALGIPKPVSFDYPDELRPWMHRDVYVDTLGEIRRRCMELELSGLPMEPAFIKPKTIAKAFNGHVIKGVRDLIYAADVDDKTEVYVCEVFEFKSEYRCFVIDGKLIDARHYEGDFRLPIKFRVVEAAVGSFTSAPRAYALDFGLDMDDRTTLVEATDGYAIGCYGMQSIDYARFLEARWKEFHEQYNTFGAYGEMAPDVQINKMI